jgi:hypothetical protein
MCEERRSEGRNLVRMVALHPELQDDLAPRAGQSPSHHPRLRRFVLHLLRSGGTRSPRVYAGVSALATGAASAEALLRRGDSRRLLYLALFMSNLAGVAEEDHSGHVLQRRLGLF